MAETKARIWTTKELDDVHPLPDGWTWQVSDFWHTWAAVFADGHEVSTADGRVRMVGPEGGLSAPPDDVALAVILASKGLDSLAAIADALDERAQVSSSTVAASAMIGAAAMLRRGTVQP